MARALASDQATDAEKGSQSRSISSDINGYDDDGRPRRTGNLWTASAHVITALNGSGVLCLAWSIAHLGWIAGPIILMLFAVVTYVTSMLLADCYRYPDPVTGKRNYTYNNAVREILGPTQQWLCTFTQCTLQWATAIGYTVTASTSMTTIIKDNCLRSKGESSLCHISNKACTITFGVIQLIVSQIPNFHTISWLSIVASAMSFSYSLIGLGLGIATILGGGHSHDSMDGISIGHGLGDVSTAKELWNVFQALGNVAFAYTFSDILIEIQDTLSNPPSENKTMKKATSIGIATTSILYMTVGCVGYAAFGNSAPGNFLSGFAFYQNYWLIDFANACIVVQSIGAYQVFSQPLFAIAENWTCEKLSQSRLIHKEYAINIPYFGVVLSTNLCRFLWRTTFVMSTTFLAMLFPFFNAVLGLIGAYGFWPLTVYFPIALHITQQKIRIWSTKWMGLQLLSVMCLLASIAAALGSIEGIYEAVQQYYFAHFMAN